MIHLHEISRTGPFIGQNTRWGAITSEDRVSMKKVLEIAVILAQECKYN
jgi:hypothetical protein